jgi:hypothetical protein
MTLSRLFIDEIADPKCCFMRPSPMVDVGLCLVHVTCGKIFNKMTLDSLEKA